MNNALLDAADMAARTIADTLRHNHFSAGDKDALETVRRGLIAAIRLELPNYGKSAVEIAKGTR